MRLTLPIENPEEFSVPTFTLPPKEYQEIIIPTEQELTLIWQEMNSGKYRPELALTILLASWVGLRISEILGLKFRDIDGNHINIHTAKVRSINGSVTKGPKSYAGYRRIKAPREILNIIEAIPHESADEFVINCHRSTINRQFHNLCKNINLPPFEIKKTFLQTFWTSTWASFMFFHNLHTMIPAKKKKPCNFNDF